MMLDRPQLADLVIPDLARWEDWSVMDRLVELFKNADEESSWVRVPVINYLRACPLPKAKEHLDELAKIDPESVKRANSFFPFAGTAPAAAAATTRASGNRRRCQGRCRKDAATKDTTAESPRMPPTPRPRWMPRPRRPPTEQTDAKSEQAETPAKHRQASAAGAAVPGSRVSRPPRPSAAGLAQRWPGAWPAPQPPASSLRCFGGLAGAAACWVCAFWSS